MIYYGKDGNLEYDFQVAPGGDARAIHLAYQGTSAIRVDASGDLILSTPSGDIRQRKPVAYQNGSRRIPTAYRIEPDRKARAAGGLPAF